MQYYEFPDGGDVSCDIFYAWFGATFDLVWKNYYESYKWRYAVLVDYNERIRTWKKSL